MSKRATIHVESDFDGYGRRLERNLVHAMGHGMSHVVAQAKATPSRYKIESIKQSIGATAPKRPKGAKGGLVATVLARDWRGWWFEQGTLKRRKRKLHRNTLRRRETASGQERLAKVEGNEGVRAQRMIQRGLRLGWPGYLVEIGKALKL